MEDELIDLLIPHRPILHDDVAQDKAKFRELQSIMSESYCKEGRGG